MVLDPFETVVVLVALLSGVWLWREWTSVATSRLNRSLFSRTAHRRGQEVTRARLVFTSDRPAAQLHEALRGELGIPAGAQTLLFEQLYVSRTTPRAVEYTFGSRVHTSFRTMVVLDDLPAGGCEGTYEVRTWEESHGLVNDLDQLQGLQRRVLSALPEVGATVAVAAREPERVAAAKRIVRMPARPQGRRRTPARLRLGGARP
jgi:hypothetical protein